LVLEHQGWRAADSGSYPFPLADRELDYYRPLLRAIIEDRVSGRSPAAVAHAFQAAVADGLAALADSPADGTLPVEFLFLRHENFRGVAPGLYL
jgi:hypothetical protein